MVQKKKKIRLTNVYFIRQDPQTKIKYRQLLRVERGWNIKDVVIERFFDYAQNWDRKED